MFESSRRKDSFQRAMKLAVLASLLAAVLTATLLVASSDQPRHRMEPLSDQLRAASSLRLPRPARHGDRINSKLRRSFAVLRHRPDQPVAHTADAVAFDALVPRIVDRWLTRQGSVLGTASPQNVEIFAADGTDVALLAGSNGICMAVDATGEPNVLGGYNGTCGSAASVVDQGLSLSVGTAAGAYRVVGLMPDTNPSVTVTFADGRTSQVPVQSNIFNEAVGQPSIASVKFHTGSGQVSSFVGRS